MLAAIINILIGLGLMIYAALPGVSKVAADSYYITCPLVITFAITSLWEINRNVRYLNMLMGGWFIIAPFLLHFPHFMPMLSSVLAGIAVLVLSLLPRKVKGHYGGGWISLFQKNPPHNPGKTQQQSGLGNDT